MPIYEIWVDVPVDSRPTTTAKRPMKVQITANTPVDAVSMAAGQYGQENIKSYAVEVKR